jgi:hypothetical protein
MMFPGLLRRIDTNMQYNARLNISILTVRTPISFGVGDLVVSRGSQNRQEGLEMMGTRSFKVGVR